MQVRRFSCGSRIPDSDCLGDLRMLRIEQSDIVLLMVERLPRAQHVHTHEVEDAARHVHQRDVVRCLGHCHVEFDISLGILECIKFAPPLSHARHKPIQFLDVRIRGAKSRELSCDALDTVAQFQDVINR